MLWCFNFKLLADMSTMGTKRSDAEVKALLLPLNAAKFYWVSNEVLAMKSEYCTNNDLDELRSLPLDHPFEDEKWLFHSVGDDEKAC